MHLIAMQEFYYNGKDLKPGTEFEAPDLHGMLFIEHGRAKAKNKEYLTTAVKAEEAPPVETLHNPRGRYKRRDMRPQE